MSYCCSGCGGLNMYNTSRHDHFLWLKPLKMAPYFLKPIDLLRKSVCICPEITCSLNPRTLRPPKPSSSQTLLRNRAVHNKTRIMAIFCDLHMWSVKKQVYGCKGCCSSGSRFVTVLQCESHFGFTVLVEIQTHKKPTVAHKPVNLIWCIMQRWKKDKSPFIYSSQKKPDANSTVLTFLGRK